MGRKRRQWLGRQRQRRCVKHRQRFAATVSSGEATPPARMTGLPPNQLAGLVLQAVMSPDRAVKKIDFSLHGRLIYAMPFSINMETASRMLAPTLDRLEHVFSCPGSNPARSAAQTRSKCRLHQHPTWSRSRQSDVCVLPQVAVAWVRRASTCIKP
jgi:hypothetical protein